MIIFGRQSDVTLFAGRIPFPWSLEYAEIIAVVPGLRALCGRNAAEMPVTYLPRLYMDSWRATLIGRGLFGFAKAWARIHDDGRTYAAVNRRGQRLFDAQLHGIGNASGLTEAPHVLDMAESLQQPIALAAGRRLALARFVFDWSTAVIRPVDVGLQLWPSLLISLPKIHSAVTGIDRHPAGAFQLTAKWELKRVHPEEEL